MLINNLSEFTPGEAVQCSAHVRRVLAPNPGMMTGPGTNTYLIGKGNVAVLDPGPINKNHLEALLKATEGETIRWILSTHTHSDHSPGTIPLLNALKEVRGQAETVEIIGLPAPIHKGSPLSTHDESFQPSILPAHGDTYAIDELTIEIIHTPGHASNHLCFLLKEENLLFTGDHIMDGSTVVIAPPDGDMKAYIESLALLKSYTISHLAPAHGNIIDNPKAIVDATIAHRLKREGKVVDGIKANPNSTLKELVSTVYDDTPVFLHPIAEFSLKAHLLKLEVEGKVTLNNDRWQWV